MRTSSAKPAPAARAAIGDARAAEEYLLSRELFGVRLGLGRMRRLMDVLGMPQRRFASVHVVGTNGKSSTARMVAAILARHGLRAGSYTSPHLRSFRERVEVSGEPIGEGELAAAVARAAEAAELVERALEDPDERVTQFEALTAAAYWELARQGVEVAAVEAGLGGRFDATNVIPSKVQALTGVALDHTRWLGDTLAAIAGEKLAVVGDHGCLVAGELEPEPEAVARRVVRERRARFVRAPAEPPPAEARALRLRGGFQRRNWALARTACEAFLGELDPEATLAAAASVEAPGRLEVVARDPLTVHDAAHNPAGARALAQALPEVAGERPLVAVLSVLDDKDARGILAPLVPLCEQVVVTSCSNPRAVPAERLAEPARAPDGPPVRVEPDPHRALALARELAGPGGAVLATGSIYLIADLVREPGGARASML